MKDGFTRTKIIATVGPASSDKGILENLINAGVDTFRLNFSHGTHESHKASIENIKALNKKLGTHIGILADLQGPKIRIGDVATGSVVLVPGKEINITTKKALSTDKTLFVNYPHFAKEVKAGDSILLDDGQLELKVIRTNNKDLVTTRIQYGGVLTSKKGVNLPDSEISLPSLTKKDIEDLQFALKNGVNWVALSFVRKAGDIVDLKKRIHNSKSKARVIAKIEKPQAVKNIDEILHVTDAIMIARGDLGVEVPMEEMAIIQKDIINRCISKSKPVIIATQIMQSMVENPRPTRAEINDVANGIFDGADALMLSAETASGKYPVKVVQVMKEIAAKIETQKSIYHRRIIHNLETKTYLTDAICYNASRIADDVSARAIISMTRSGYTAIKTSSYRPYARILVIMDDITLLNTLNLVWGVETFFYDKMVSTDETIEDVKELLKKNNRVKKGDIVINTASMPLHWKGSTNMIKISRIE